jgi:hypothetical protein
MRDTFHVLDGEIVKAISCGWRMWCVAENMAVDMVLPSLPGRVYYLGVVLTNML